MRPLNYEELVAKLPIDKHGLDDELEMQAAIQHMISEQLSKAREHMELMENELESCESSAYIKVMGTAVDGGKKPSVEYAKSMVKSDRTRKQKWLDFNEARRDFEKWEGLYYAWRSRNDALQGLAKLAVANYFAVETTYDKDRGASSRHQQSRPVRRRETT